MSTKGKKAINLRGFMSIPIAARRYISELGLSSLVWSDDKFLQWNIGEKLAVLICEPKKGDFTITIGKIRGDYFLSPGLEGWSIPIKHVVCWSEIKT